MRDVPADLDVAEEAASAGQRVPVEGVLEALDLLVVGGDVGKTKLDAARKLGTQIVDEDGLAFLLRGEPVPPPAEPAGDAG